MRLRALQVENFGALERADVVFEDGLNILYGPNDLGKSTLASAIRAALLLQHGSSAARPFIPWGTTRSPTVRLTMEVDGRVYRVHKVFSHVRGGSSVLERSNDGESFSVEVEGRGVDGRLRDLLRWGLAAPGGRGGTHGFPKSFLGTVLLGEQAVPYRLLDQSLGGDAEDTGKARLVEALQAMATDPTYQSVLLEAQRRVDEAFTAKGRRSTRRGSPFERLSVEIKQRREASEQLVAQVAQNDAVVSRLGDVTARRDTVMAERADAAATMSALEEAASAQQVRATLRAAVDSAQAALAEIQRNQEEIARLQSERKAWAAQVPEAEAEVERRAAAVRAVRGELERARAELGALERGDDPQPRARAQAQAEAKAAIEAEETHLQGLQARIERWRAARAELDAATATRSKIDAELQGVDRARAHAEAEAEAAREEHLRLAAAARWRDVQSLQERLSEVQQQRVAADNARAKAADKRAEAAAVGVRDDLPNADVVAEIERAGEALAVAEAAVRGGVRVALDLPDSSWGEGVRATIDDAPEIELASDARVDASHRVVLRLGAGTVHVQAGDPDAHAALEQARSEWAAHADHLETLGLSSPRDLRDALTARDAARARRTALLRDAEIAEAKASTSHVDPASVQAELEAATRALGDVDAGRCADEVERHGDELDARVADADAEAGQAERTVSTMLARAGELRVELRLAVQREEAATRLDRDARGSDDDLALGGTDDPTRASAWFANQRTAVAARRADLEAQERSGREAAQRRRDALVSGLAEVEARLEGAEAGEREARARLDEARASGAAAVAALEVRREQAHNHDPLAAAERVAQAQDALAAHPEGPPVTEEAVEAARAELRRADEALEEADRVVRQQEGALQQVGGQVVRERAQMAREALDEAVRHEAEVALDYDGWQLLLTTMREVENETGAHLGRALDEELSVRLEALSEGRYRGAALGADLETEGVVTASGVQSLDRFSEGVKEQVATLLRVSVAEHLDTALVLDDHLAQTDPARAAWFRDLLGESARKIQVIVLTCRPDDYVRDVASGPSEAHVVDLASTVRRRP